MRKILVVSLLFLFLFFPRTADAHLLGQPPFFKVNGVYAGFYTVTSSSLDNFNLPQDAAPENYIVGGPLDFELDINQLPVPVDIVKKTTFAWDFGDGEQGNGLKNTHVYKKMGSYILSITAAYSDNGQNVPPQLLETIMLQILPNKDYKLPKSVIVINGNNIKNPTTDSVHFDPGVPVTLDGSKSNAPSSKIVSYFWDVGDSTTSNKVTLTHVYSKNYQLAFPLLRIKDANGFIVDNFAQLDSTPGKGKGPQEILHTVKEKKGVQLIWYILGGIGIGIVLIIFALKRRKH